MMRRRSSPLSTSHAIPAGCIIYEKIWRRIGYYIASSRSFSKEMQTVLRHADNKSMSGPSIWLAAPAYLRGLWQALRWFVIGLDLSWPMLLHAQRLMQRSACKYPVIRATAFHMPFVDAAFQYVNCCGALHLFDRPEAALREIARILDPRDSLRANHNTAYSFCRTCLFP